MRCTRDSGQQTSVSACCFILKVFHLFDIRGFHTAKLRIPVVVRGLRDPGFAADILNNASGFDGYQNGDDLVFSASGLTHGDLLQGHNQYAGSSKNE